MAGIGYRIKFNVVCEVVSNGLRNGSCYGYVAMMPAVICMWLVLDMGMEEHFLLPLVLSSPLYR